MNKLNYYNYNYIINVIKEKNGEKYLAYFFYTITIILSFVLFLPGKKDKIPIILKIYIPLCLFIIAISLIIYYYVEQDKINQMIVNKIEKIHNEKFYDVFLKLVTNNMESGASEYEIYFNYILKNHPDKIELRKLQFENVSTLNLELDLDYISYHWYQRS